MITIVIGLVILIFLLNLKCLKWQSFKYFHRQLTRGEDVKTERYRQSSLCGGFFMGSIGSSGSSMSSLSTNCRHHAISSVAE